MSINVGIHVNFTLAPVFCGKMTRNRVYTSNEYNMSLSTSMSFNPFSQVGGQVDVPNGENEFVLTSDLRVCDFVQVLWNCLIVTVNVESW